MKLVKLVSSPVDVGLQYVVVVNVMSTVRVISMSRKGRRPFSSSSTVKLMFLCKLFSSVRQVDT